MRGGARLSAQVCALLAVATGGPAWAADSAEEPAAAPMVQAPVGCVAAIEFTGNKRTREQVLRQEIELREGAPATPEQIEGARQAIMDLGLFEWVKAHVEPAPTGEKVVFEMKEKLYFLPIPLLNGDPSERNYSYGLELRADNLGGWNQTVRVEYEHERSISEETPVTRRGSVSYYYPRLAGSPYNLGLNYSLSQQDLNLLDANGDTTAKYHRNITQLSGGVSRWLNIAGPSRGWSGGMGAAFQERRHRLLSGTPGDLVDAQAISLTASIGWDDVHDKGYYFTGSAYGWRGELGDHLLGSDFDFTRHLFYYRVYNQLTPEINLNWQLRVGFADGLAFGSPAYGIGGFNTLRGYENDIEGNALALSNLEYHHQFDAYPSMRGVWFLDLGNTYRRVSDMDPGELEAGTGLGVRWRIQSLVNVTLSADAAYGIGPGTQVFYLTTTGSF